MSIALSACNNPAILDVASDLLSQEVSFNHGHKAEDGTHLFRYIDRHMYVECLHFPVLRTTPACYEIQDWGGKKRLILKRDDGARYAYATRLRAWDNYCRRKKRQLAILTTQLENITKIEEALDANRPFC